MEKFSLTALAREHLRKAADASAGRSSHTIYGGHEHGLRQTLITLIEGQGLSAHDSPGESTIHVISGRVRLSCGENSWEGSSGDLLVVPRQVHALTALADSAVLLTVVKQAQAAARLPD